MQGKLYGTVNGFNAMCSRGKQGICGVRKKANSITGDTEQSYPVRSYTMTVAITHTEA